MHNTFRTEPAFALIPGVTVTENGVTIAVIFRDTHPCGILLYPVDGGEPVNIPFTDEYRMGRLYSVKITGIDSQWWGYRLYSDGKSFVDPCARQLITLGEGEDEITVAGFYYRPDEQPSPIQSCIARPWREEFIYILHVRGFTKNAPEGVLHPGTFQGAAERIPYLISLGVTAVELMPVYELRVKDTGSDAPRTMEEALRLYPVTIDGTPARDHNFENINYWGYGKGYYYAPKRLYGTPGYPGGPQKEFADMVDSFHRAGIAVYLQFYFTETESAETQSQIARYYVTHYGIDGIRLMGQVEDLKGFAGDPLLSDIRIIADGIPFDEITRVDETLPGIGTISVANMANRTDRFSDLIRHFVKSDDYVLRDFLREFLLSPAGHGNIHYVCDPNGFTLHDLVSYNERHNQANGEGGLDGREDNISWNCGVEGETDREDVLRLRRNQIRNFLLLLFLSQGTPALTAGDECLNGQEGNNNPYCQDNEIGWIDWRDDEEAARITDFVRKLIGCRHAHPVFVSEKSFAGTDSMAIGYPDLSFHGAEAWKPDFEPFSHTIGICICENYFAPGDEIELLYLAVNMHWAPQHLGLPKLPPQKLWAVEIDTSLEEPFLTSPQAVEDQHFTVAAPRSVQVLRTIKAPKPVRKRKKRAKESSNDKKTVKVSSGTKDRQQNNTGEVLGALKDHHDAPASGDEGLLSGGIIPAGPSA